MPPPKKKKANVLFIVFIATIGVLLVTGLIIQFQEGGGFGVRRMFQGPSFQTKGPETTGPAPAENASEDLKRAYADYASTDPSARIRGLSEIARLDPNNAVAYGRGLTGDPDAAVRQAALTFLGSTRNPTVVGDAVRALSDREASVRAAAEAALVNLSGVPNARVADYVGRSLGDRNVDVAQAALRILQTCMTNDRPSVARSLGNGLNHPDMNIIMATLGVAANLPREDLAPLRGQLISLSNHPKLEIRMQASALAGRM